MTRKIALLIESSRGYGRDLLRGVAAYARTHGPFSIYRHERALGESVPAWLENWKGDGIIARIESQILADFLVDTGVPVVDLRAKFRIPKVPTIETNDLSVARLACDHLLERGIRNFAYCGYESANFSQRRRIATAEYLAEFGIVPSTYCSPAGALTDTTDIEAEGMVHQTELARWLLTLPKQTGLIACNDIRAAQILSTCREVNIKVPDDLAVIGVDDDRLICELTSPPLSSVAVDAYRVGYMAATVLEHMMRGRYPAEERIFINAQSVVSRQSTELLAIDDSDVVSALQFIRHKYGAGISVDDVASAVNLSRSTLDRRFAQFTGTTVKAEIIRTRLERIKQLLVDTDYTLSTVATMVGYAHVEYMSTMFKQFTGETPGQYRQLYQSLRTTRE
jgi:LacI family transcriptional regulator